MTLLSTDGRSLGADAIPIAEDLGRRAAVAIENARLFEAARRANHARDEVLAVVAHDLRNPLNLISMSAQLLVDQPRLKTAKLSGSILRGARQMSRLISDLLDVTQIEQGRLALRCEQVALAPLVREAVEIARATADATTTIAQTVAPELPPIDADAGRLLQVLGNLLQNAVKFTPVGGHISVEATHTAGTIRIAIRDSGPGIPLQQRAHVFDSFWQGARADRRGVGLGLAIAKAIVEAHGGVIGLDPSPGPGASVWFTLPCPRVASSPADDEPRQASDLRPRDQVRIQRSEA